jgi:steroid 5-alpha reductase family enzyme
MIGLLVGGWIACAVVFAIVWLLQRRWNHPSIVDIAWPYGIGALALAYGLLSEGLAERRLLVSSLGAIWSLRLGSYVLRRVLTMPEDRRYEALRRQHQEKFQSFLFYFYQMQAFTVPIFALPILVAMRRDAAALDVRDLVGVVIWLVAVVGESVADAQLAAFRRSLGTTGRVCDRGLWRYSRHPNYFFEWVHWISYVAIGWSAPLGWLTLIGPALMFLFLWFVTGIPVTEQRLIESRGDAYRDYQRRTSVFFPWFPKARTR